MPANGLQVAYLGDALIPSFDHLAFSDHELEWLSSVARRIELRAIFERA